MSACGSSSSSGYWASAHSSPSEPGLLFFDRPTAAIPPSEHLPALTTHHGRYVTQVGAVRAHASLLHRCGPCLAHYKPHPLPCPRQRHPRTRCRAASEVLTESEPGIVGLKIRVCASQRALSLEVSGVEMATLLAVAALGVATGHVQVFYNAVSPRIRWSGWTPTVLFPILLQWRD